jgi:hypothetical protein
MGCLIVVAHFRQFDRPGQALQTQRLLQVVYARLPGWSAVKVKDLDSHDKELLDGDMVSCQALGRFVR